MRVNPSISPRHAKALPNPIVGTQHNKKAALETIERDLFVCQIYIYIYICLPAFLSFFFCHMQRKSQHFVICLLIGRLRHSLSHCVCSLSLAAKLPEILHSLILCRIKVNASSHLCVFVLCLQDLCQNIGSSLSALGNVAYVQQYQSAAAALLCQLIADFKPLSLTT